MHNKKVWLPNAIRGSIVCETIWLPNAVKSDTSLIVHKACFKAALQFSLRQSGLVARPKLVAGVAATHRHLELAGSPKPPTNHAALACR